MRRLILITVIVLSCSAASAQGQSSPVSGGDGWGMVSRQLGGGRWFTPDNRTFFKQAREEFGFVPSLFIMSDRITRNTRIGIAGMNMMAEDGLIHEGTEAYKLHKPFSASKPYAPVKPLEADGSAPLFASHERDFVDYLIGNGLGEDACTLLSSTSYHPSDTLSFLRGWTDYSTKRLAEAAAEFSQVPSTSAFYDKSLFFNMISNAHLGAYGRSAELLDGYEGTHKELCSFEKAGLALLMNDKAGYKEAAGSFTYSHYLLSEHEKTIQELYSKKYEKKGKSPAVAAAASAVIPGLGKIYAGELGEGISTLLITGSLAAITAESWAKNGVTDWKTLLFGTLGAVFHLGNIYGSYVSVSIHENYITHEQDTAILYNMHIPLRSFFD